MFSTSCVRRTSFHHFLKVTKYVIRHGIITNHKEHHFLIPVVHIASSCCGISTTTKTSCFLQHYPYVHICMSMYVQLTKGVFWLNQLLQSLETEIMSLYLNIDQKLDREQDTCVKLNEIVFVLLNAFAPIKSLDQFLVYLSVYPIK